MLLRRGKTRVCSASREGLVPLLICMTLESAVEEQEEKQRMQKRCLQCWVTECADLPWWVAFYFNSQIKCLGAPRQAQDYYSFQSAFVKYWSIMVLLFQKESRAYRDNKTGGRMPESVLDMVLTASPVQSCRIPLHQGELRCLWQPPSPSLNPIPNPPPLLWGRLSGWRGVAGASCRGTGGCSPPHSHTHSLAW